MDEFSDFVAPNVFTFACMMAYRVKAVRGGEHLSYVAECRDFMESVVGHKLAKDDPLPDGYSWTPIDATIMAHEMMEYDG